MNLDNLEDFARVERKGKQYINKWFSRIGTNQFLWYRFLELAEISSNGFSDNQRSWNHNNIGTEKKSFIY